MEIVQFKEFLIITGLSFLQAGVSVYVKTQAFVYISGRMLEILNKNRSRNILALVLTAIFTAGHMYSLSGGGAVYLQMWEYLDIFSKAIFFYVLVGFNLFKNAYTFIDKKITKK